MVIQINQFISFIIKFQMDLINSILVKDLSLLFQINHLINHPSFLVIKLIILVIQFMVLVLVILIRFIIIMVQLLVMLSFMGLMVLLLKLVKFI